MCILGACNFFGTKMEFSFNTKTAADSKDSKAIYINDDMEKLELSAELKVDSASVTLDSTSVTLDSTSVTLDSIAPR